MTTPPKNIPTLTMLRALRNTILSLARQHGAYDVRVFGSVARDEATTDSDIDFLARWDDDHISAWGGVGLDLALEALLQCRVDVISENALSLSIKPSVLAEAITL